MNVRDYDQYEIERATITLRNIIFYQRIRALGIRKRDLIKLLQRSYQMSRVEAQQKLSEFVNESFYNQHLTVDFLIHKLLNK